MAYYKQIPLEFPEKDLRIVRLRNGGPEDTVTIEVIMMDPYNGSSGDRDPHDSTFSKLPYEALSWCWGRDGDVGVIKVVDTLQHETETFDMSISASLTQALRALR